MCSLKTNRLPFQRIWIYSKVLDRDVENIIILPEKYDTNRKYPVLYLLAGAGNPVDSWVTLTKLSMYAVEYDMIIATPNNGWRNNQSWYVDSHIVKNSSYETYLTDEFIEYMDSNYSVMSSRSGRAISGISMGGHGALTLAAKHTALYGSVSSFMGIMNLESWKLKGTWLNESITDVLGPYESNRELWNKNSAVNLIENFRGAKIKFCCGTRDTIEYGWGALPDNEVLHEKLSCLNIEHEYFSFPGGHGYADIDVFLKEYLLFHFNNFK